MRELDHELKNPLQAIKLAFADLEQAGGLTDSLQMARSQVERIRLLIGRLRRIASVTPGSLALETVDLKELVDDAIELAGTSNPACADRLRIVVPQTPWRPAPVRADRDLAVHAIFKLLENAFKYSPESSVVEVRLTEDYSGAIIEIVDDRIGIDPADLPHITEELYRSDRTNWIEGSGLGLALVQRVASAHNGRLDLRSQPGEGTVASLRLPLAEPNASRG